MKIGTLQKLRRDDLAQFGTLPTWVDPMISIVNSALDLFTQALTGGLDFVNNFNAKEFTLKLTSGTALEVGVPTGKRVKTIQVLEVPGASVTGWGFARKNNGNISVTVTWSGGGTANVTFLIFFG